MKGNFIMAYSQNAIQKRKFKDLSFFQTNLQSLKRKFFCDLLKSIKISDSIEFYKDDVELRAKERLDEENRESEIPIEKLEELFAK